MGEAYDYKKKKIAGHGKKEGVTGHAKSRGHAVHGPINHLQGDYLWLMIAVKSIQTKVERKAIAEFCMKHVIKQMGKKSKYHRLTNIDSTKCEAVYSGRCDVEWELQWKPVLVTGSAGEGWSLSELEGGDATFNGVDRLVATASLQPAGSWKWSGKKMATLGEKRAGEKETKEERPAKKAKGTAGLLIPEIRPDPEANGSSKTPASNVGMYLRVDFTPLTHKIAGGIEVASVKNLIEDATTNRQMLTLVTIGGVYGQPESEAQEWDDFTTPCDVLNVISLVQPMGEQEWRSTLEKKILDRFENV